MSRSRASARKEQGQVLVLLALMIPMLFAMGAIVMDVGNWFVHKRHLQTQVDAAVLAAGTQFVGCFLDPTGTNDEIRDEALRFAGDTARDAATVNQQVQEPDDVRVVLNSAEYWPTGATPDPSTGYGLDWTMDGDPGAAGDQSSLPCDAKFLDAKATDDSAPLLWGLLPLSPSPKARARVEIRKVQGLSGMLPWAVPENNPRRVVALWVDETHTNTVRSWTFLNGPMDPNDTQVLNGETASLWSGPSSVEVVGQTGMIVLQSRQLLTDDDLAGRTLAEICSMPTAVCFGSVRSGNSRSTTNRSGVGLIRGTPLTDSSDNRVVLTDVELTTLDPPAGIPNPPTVIRCSTTDPSSSPYFLWNGDCQVRIRAQVEFGDLPNPRVVRVARSPFGNGPCNGGQIMEDTDGWWESPWLTIDAGSGRNPFYFCWRSGTGNNVVQGNLGDQVIQMAFAANTDPSPTDVQYSGPMVHAAILASPACVTHAHSLVAASQTVCVEVGLQPPLRVTPGTDPPIFLRIAGAGSLNQMVDCDPPPRQPEDEIRDGCQVPYQVNLRDLVCEPTWSTSNLPPTLSPNDPNWVDPDCVEANPGQVSAMSRGLRQRFEDPPPVGAGCPPNLWQQYRAAGNVPPPEDPRFVTLIVAEYGTFDGQGNFVLPITKFAGFYVTGWFEANGAQFANGCPDNDPPPTPPFCPRTSQSPCAADSQAVQGAVWGYFITQVVPSPRGTPSDQLCNFDELGTCIAVLVE